MFCCTIIPFIGLSHTRALARTGLLVACIVEVGIKFARGLPVFGKTASIFYSFQNFWKYCHSKITTYMVHKSCFLQLLSHRELVEPLGVWVMGMCSKLFNMPLCFNYKRRAYIVWAVSVACCGTLPIERG